MGTQICCQAGWPQGTLGSQRMRAVMKAAGLLPHSPTPRPWGSFPQTQDITTDLAGGLASEFGAGTPGTWEDVGGAGVLILPSQPPLSTCRTPGGTGC